MLLVMARTTTMLSCEERRVVRCVCFVCDVVVLLLCVLLFCAWVVGSVVRNVASFVSMCRGMLSSWLLLCGYLVNSLCLCLVVCWFRFCAPK